MLKTHLQSIVTYFSNNSIDSPIASQKANLTGSPARKTHLQTVIGYFSNGAQSDSAQSGSAQSDSAQSNGTKQPNSGTHLEGDKGKDRDQTLGQFWRSILIANSDPQVKEQVNRSGQVYWQVYDPVTDQSHAFFSEDDVYQWLEHRYYQ